MAGFIITFLELVEESFNINVNSKYVTAPGFKPGANFFIWKLVETN